MTPREQLSRVRGALFFSQPLRFAREATIPRLVVEASGDAVTIGPRGEIFGPARRAMLRIERGGHVIGDVLLIRRGLTRIVAVVSQCPHLGQALDSAPVRSGSLVCPGHAGAYSLRTGRARADTARRLGVSSPLRILPVRPGKSALIIDVSGLGK